MRAHIYFFFLVISIFQIGKASGQEIITSGDIGVRTGIGVDYKLNKFYELSFNQELRLFNNATQLDEMISDIGISYKIDKNFSIGSNVRYMLNKQEDNSYTNDLRYNFDFKFKHKIVKHIKFKYRLRYQQSRGNFFTLDRDNTEKTNTNFRNKFELNYKDNNHLYYLSSELFRKYEIYRCPYFNKVRFYIGDEITSKKGEINLALGYEHNLGISYPYNFYFICTSFTFKRKHEK